MKQKTLDDPIEEKISQLTEDYKVNKLSGGNPDLNQYKDAFPQGTSQIGEEIEAWEFFETAKGTWQLLNLRLPLEERLASLHKRLDEIDEQRKEDTRVISLFEEFLKIRRGSEEAVTTLAAEVSFAMDDVREFYDEHFIDLTLGKVHVTIESDNEHIVLHFIGDSAFDGLQAVIFRLDSEEQKREKWRSMTQTIMANDVRFPLSALGLTAQELNKIGFRLKIGDQQIKGRL